MKALGIILLSTYFISIGSACSSGLFNNNGICQSCPKNCHFCLSKTNCLACFDSYFLLNGSCFNQCEYPMYTFLSDNNQVICKTVETKIVTCNEIIIDEYDSSNGVQTMFLEGLNEMENVEIVFWIRFDDFEGTEDEKNFFIISNNFVPLQDIYDIPYITKLGLKGRNLTGPTEINNINVRVSSQRWYMISIVFERHLEFELHSGIALHDFYEQEVTILKSETYYSAMKINYFSVLNLGTLPKTSALKFRLRGLRFIFVRQLDHNFKGNLMIQADLNQIYYYNINKKSDVQDLIKKNGFISIDLDIEQEFSIISISLYLGIGTSIFPSKFFKIIQEEEIIYSFELVLNNTLIQLNNNEKRIPFNSNKKLTIELLLIKIDDEKVILSDSGNFIHLNRSSNLKIEILSSIYSTKMQEFYLKISKNPSLVKLKRENINQYGDFCSILGNLDSTFCYKDEKKICQDDKSLDFSYNLDNCFLEKRHICREKIPLCDICFNETYCFRCNNGTYNYKGSCSGFEDPKLICIRQDTTNQSICDDCEKNPFEILNENGICINCIRAFYECLAKNTRKFCTNLKLSENCVINDSNISCSQNCDTCINSKSESLCLECKFPFDLNEAYSCAKCPPKYIMDKNLRCVFVCKPPNIFFNDECHSCHLSNDIFSRPICSPLCINRQISYNNKCADIEKIGFCVQKGPRWCELCLKKVEGYECRFKYIHHFDFDLKRIKSKEVINDLYLGNYLCPENILNNSKIFESCSVKENLEETLILDGIKNLKTNYDLVQRKISRLCLDYVEGLFKIQINETCIYVPNSHYSLMQYGHNFMIIKSIMISHIMISHNMQITHIKLTNDSQLIGTITQDTLLIDRCPDRFYQDLNGFCIYCGNECLVCSGPHESECSYKNEKDSKDLFNNFPYMYKEIFEINNYKAEAQSIPISFSKCPISCKSCFYTGKKYICLACINEELFIDNDSPICSCKNDKKFDHSTGKCVDECPENTKLKLKECVPKCRTISSSNIIYKYWDATHNKCTSFCSDQQTIKHMEFDDDELCINNNFIQSYPILIFDETVKFAKNLTDILINKGIIQLVTVPNLNKFSFLIQYLSSIDDLSQGSRLKLIQILTVIVRHFLDIDLSYFISDSLDRFIQETSSLEIIWKIHYLYQIANSKFIALKRSKFFKCSTKNSQNQTQIDFQMTKDLKLIFEGFNSDGSIIFTLFENPKHEVYLSFYISMNSSLTKKFKFSVESSNALSKAIFMANFTSQYMDRIEVSKQIEVNQRCIYFVMQAENFVNESFRALIDDDLFYGTQHRQNRKIKISKDEENRFLIYEMIIIALIGLGIAYFICIQKKRKSRISKPKFVQMKNMDYEDEEEEEEEADI